MEAVIDHVLMFGSETSVLEKNDVNFQRKNNLDHFLSWAVFSFAMSALPPSDHICLAGESA